MLCKVILTFTESVYETLVCEHSEIKVFEYFFSCGNVYNAAQLGSYL